MPIVAEVAGFTSKEFDYLVLGGGTAGLALAVRLSEDTNVMVGVIEAGDHHPDLAGINVPGLMAKLIANPNYDWTFFSTPQHTANNRVALQPRGKALGGSSMLNFTGMLRGTIEEYDALEALGNPGWNWESMLKYMKKSERLFPHSLTLEDARRFAVNPDSAFHGFDGPVAKSFPLHVTDISSRFLDSAEKLGVPRNFEHSNGRPVGGFVPFVSVDPRTAKRSYSASAYFVPNASRPNLLVLTGAHVTKVLFQKGSNGLQHAVGAEFIKGGTKFVVSNIRKEVILSAGTFQTPQLLELSGIGSRSRLDEVGIDCLIDLPGVGENLQDHITVPTIIELNPRYETMSSLADPAVLEKHQKLYEQQKGLLSAVADPFFAFIPALTMGSEDDVRRWKIQFEVDTVTNMAAKTEPSLRDGLQKQYELLKLWFSDKTQPVAQFLNICGSIPISGFTPEPGKVYNSLMTVFSHPLSRGSVHISSADPIAPPQIDPNYFANSADLDLMVQTVNFALRLIDTHPISEAIVAIAAPVLKDGKCRREAILEHIKNTCGTSYHPVGTAAMLPRESGGVVNSNLIVYGTNNLRVVDLSILPMELSCNTQTAAYAIAEKAADILKGSI